jgi:integrase
MEGVRERIEAIAAFDGAGMPGDEVAPGVLDLLVDLKGHIDRSYKRPEAIYSVARVRLRQKMGSPAIDKAARAIIKQTKEEFDATQAAAAKIVELKNKNQTVLTLEYVERVAERLRGGSTLEDRVVLLMLSCGARKGEILNPEVSDFEYAQTQTGTTDERKIKQVGVSKKKDGRGFEIEKPLLWIQAGEFLSALALVRNEVFKYTENNKRTGGDLKTATKSFSSKLERYCGHLWPQHVWNGYRTGTHICRAIYANAAHKFHGGGRSSLTSFVKEVLGHEAMGTAANYMNVAIAMPDDRMRMEEAKRQSDRAFEGRLVEATDRDGVSHFLEKIPIRQMSQEDRVALLFATIRSVEGMNIEPKKKLLKALGFDGKFLAVCI